MYAIFARYRLDLHPIPSRSSGETEPIFSDIILGFRNELIISQSEFKQQPCIELARGEVIGHGILLVVDIGDPVIRVDIRHVEQVEKVYAQPYIPEASGGTSPHVSVFVVQYPV